jgi:hypothetical protein
MEHIPVVNLHNLVYGVLGIEFSMGKFLKFTALVDIHGVKKASGYGGMLKGYQVFTE